MGTSILNDVQFYSQLVAGLLIVPVLLLRYWSFRWSFYRFVTAHLGLTAILVLVYLLIYALIGTGLGVPYLIWDEDFLGRFFSAFGATLVLGILGVIAFYLDPFPWKTARKTEAWLQADEHLKRQVSDWWRHRAPRLVAPPSPTLAAVPGFPQPTFLERVGFVFNVLIDPVSITPFQSWLDPRQETATLLQRFLRTARTPFLLLLLAPAVLPRFFYEVPRVAPTRDLWTGAGSGDEVIDITRNWGAYIFAIATWLAGIIAAVLFIKVLIRLSDFFHARSRWNPGVRPVNFPPPGPAAWVTAHRLCPHHGAPSGCPGAGCPRGEPVPGEQSPPECESRRQINTSMVVFVSIFLGIYMLLGYTRHQMNSLRCDALRTGVNLDTLRFSLAELLSTQTPGFAICALLALLAMGLGIVASLPRLLRLPVTVGFLIWLGIANNDPFKFRFETLDAYYQTPVDLRSRVDELYFREDDPPPSSGLVADSKARQSWLTLAREADPDVVDRRPKLVVVTVSGGASRSAYWTGVVLDRLERELPGFGRRVRIMAGASGGMLGTACYVTYRREVATVPTRERFGAAEPSGTLPRGYTQWVENMPLDALDDVAGEIALSEVWKAIRFWPQSEDRGIVLEKSWPVIRYPLADLAKLEERGEVPSLIFSPMMVDDGRRLMISNLDLFRDEKNARLPQSMILARTSQIAYAFTDPRSSGTNDSQDLSLSGIEFYRVFPEGRGLFLSTAVRMSASFPYVSPAVNIPSVPPRRVVDAGYYDNYGIQIANAWLTQNRRWLEENTSGVLLVQIRDSSSEKDRLDVDDSDPSLWDLATRGYQALTSPLEAIIEARYTTSSFRNDEHVQSLQRLSEQEQLIRPHLVPNTFFTTVIFENSAEVSLKVDDFWADLSTLERSDDDPTGRPTRRDAPLDVAMSWNLTRAERFAIRDRGIPYEPPREGKLAVWNQPEVRAKMRQRLFTQVFQLGPEPQMVELRKDRQQWMKLAREGKMCFPPGPERDYRLKRLEQLRNYERIINLRNWWRNAGRSEGRNPQ
jgi:hypothetical protein